jgi:hypothetical protein
MAVHRGGETASPQRLASYDAAMELGLPAALHGDLARRAAPIACGGALVASAAFIATNDPSAAGSRFPACVFHQMTGLWCPGCGLTRGTYQLFQGHIGAAFSSNIFTPVVLVAIIAVWVSWLRVSWSAPPLRLPQRSGRLLAFAIPALLIAYGTLRNIPIAPLRALAP